MRFSHSWNGMAASRQRGFSGNKCLLGFPGRLIEMYGLRPHAA